MRYPTKRSDALALLARSRWDWLRSIGRRFARPKVRIATRVARRANPSGTFRGVFDDVRYPEVVRELVDCDFIFCATDTMSSRLMFNVVCHQYLIPGIQFGTKIPAHRERGVGPIHIAVRPVTLDEGCLTCAEVISQRLLHEESLDEAVLRNQRYVEDPDVAEPSVISLNAVAAAHAVTDFLLYVTGLLDEGANLRHQLIEPQERSLMNVGVRRDPSCAYCGREEHSIFAAGDGVSLPVKLRAR
jgi:hypothetical protein